jgi:amino acid transporter
MPTREEIIREDERNLARLGYAQQLFREMGGLSNFAVSFSIISILTGAVLLFGYGLKFAGPAVNSVGWPLVSVMTLAVAASMAEIASAYPTAGGLYFWAFQLGGRTWAWTTAWLNMIGQVAITAGINIAAAIYLIGAVTRFLGLPPDVRVPPFGAATNWSFQLVVMLLILIPQVVINLWGIRLTARLSDISVWWHIGGVLLIVVLLAAMGRYHNPASFLFAWKPVGSVPPTLLACSTSLTRTSPRRCHMRSHSSSALPCGCAAWPRSRRWGGCGTPSRAMTACRELAG